MRLDIEDEARIIEADPTQIHQVLINLCSNAAHAMRANGGLLEVRLNTIAMEEQASTIHPDLHAGSYLEIMVGDIGHGMAPDVMERIFEPYFTTKGEGERGRASVWLSSMES